MGFLLGVELETLVRHEALRTRANLFEQGGERLLEHGKLIVKDGQGSKTYLKKVVMLK